MTERYVVMRHWMIELRVIDKINAANRCANLIGVLPVVLLLKNIREGIFQWNFFLGFFRDAPKEGRVQIENSLTAGIVLDYFQCFQILTVLWVGPTKGIDFIFLVHFWHLSKIGWKFAHLNSGIIIIELL